MRKSVKTPCIGVCSTVFGDEVCRGCKRFQHEIIEWNSFNDSEKTSVLNRLESLKVQILQSKIQLLDKNPDAWHEQFKAITHLRILNKYHSETLIPYLNHIKDFIKKSINNLKPYKIHLYPFLF